MKLDKKAFERWKVWVNMIKDDLQYIVNYHQVYEYFIETVNANLDHIQKNMADYFVTLFEGAMELTLQPEFDGM